MYSVSSSSQSGAHSSPHKHAAIMISEPSTYVTLISSDGFEFIVRRDCAYHSKTIKTMLDPTSNFSEASSGRCTFPDISGVLLEKVCEYFYYNEKHKGAQDVPDMEIPADMCLQLLMVADYLNGVYPPEHEVDNHEYCLLK